MPVFTAKCDSAFIVASDKSDAFNKVTRNKEAAERTKRLAQQLNITCREPSKSTVAPYEEAKPCDDEIEAIKQAEKEIADIKERETDAIGSDVLEFMDSLSTPEEIMESNSRAALIGEIINKK